MMDKKILSKWATNFLHLFPAETAHHLSIALLKMFSAANETRDLDLTIFPQELLGLKFAHPLGLAAGFDKNAEVFPNLLNMGFSFVEVGTVTPNPQPGNPLPRVFRLRKEQAIINRYGFNSKGLATMLENLQTFSAKGIIGVNLGKNKTSEGIEDFIICAKVLAEKADYFTINVSSPNTPGLRDLQTPSALKEILAGIRDVIQPKKIPLLVKISPDISFEQLTLLVEFLLEEQVEGMIISNTTISRENIDEKYLHEAGGLSGPPLKQRSTELLRRAFQIAKGQLTLIGCGGISTGKDAYEKLCAGADLLQIYTAFIYQGPLVIRQILSELQMILARDGIRNIREIIGSLE